LVKCQRESAGKKSASRNNKIVAGFVTAQEQASRLGEGPFEVHIA
jgi:hypothetical protein